MKQNRDGIFFVGLGNELNNFADIMSTETKFAAVGTSQDDL